MPKRVILATRRNGPDEGASNGPLPPELLQDTDRRLSFAAVITIAVAVLYLIYAALISDSAGPSSTLTLALFPLLLVLSLAIIVATRLGAFKPMSLVDMGLMYEVIVAACAALLVNEHPWSADAIAPGWSPVAVWVIVFPLIVPATVWRTILASLAAAAMDPLALLLLSQSGAVAAPPAELWLIRFLPNAAAVLIATAVARGLYGMREKAAAERRAGAYRLVDRLGVGGVGEVWRAEHRMLNRPAAVKLIRPTVFNDRHNTREELVGRFEREVQAMASLLSPHTVRIYDFGVTPENDFFYVMELLEGVDLYTMVERFGPLPPERVVHLLRQACDSLHEAHEQGLVHRDIKPGNLFACRWGNRLDFLKVLDFGFVKERNPDTIQTQLTDHGIAIGTPAFMPPEVARGEAEIDARADIYALGCVAFWCLTGRTVFQAASTMAMMIQHAEAEPLRPSEHSPHTIPRALDEVVLACLQKPREARPETALDLSSRLHELDIEKFWTNERKVLWWEANNPATQALAATGEFHIPGQGGKLVVDRHDEQTEPGR